MPYKWTLIHRQTFLWPSYHISSGHCVYYYCSCILSFVLYTVLCMLMIEPLVHVTLSVPCLVSMNSSSDDLIESVYYMFIPMQHISVLRIFTSLCINIQSSYICKLPCSETKSCKLSLQKCKSPLALWPPRGVTSTELKRPHFSDPTRF